MVHRGDLVIIAAYASMDEKEAEQFKPNLVFVDGQNRIKQIHHTFENGNQPMLREV
jgi:aspartate 1-decarboxylase